MSTLFRTEAIQAAQTSHLGVVIVRSPRALKSVAVLLAFIALCIVLAILLLSYTRKITVDGRVQPIGGVISIVATEAGTIDSMIESDVVTQDTVLYSLSLKKNAQGVSSDGIKLASEQKLESLYRNKVISRDLIHNQSADIDSVMRHLNVALAGRVSLLRTHKEKLEIARRVYEKHVQLYQNGFISELGLAAKKQDLLDQEGFVTDGENQINSVKQELQSKLAQQQELTLRMQQINEENMRNIESSKSELISAKLTGQTQVRSPMTAVIANKLVSKGQLVVPGQVLMSLIPEKSKCQVDIYIPSDNMAFIKAGSAVNIKYDAFPYQKFGSQSGKITHVSKSPLAADELKIGLKPGYYYKASVSMPKNSISAYGTETLIPVGASVKADIAVDKRRIIEWILEPLFTAKELFA